MQSTWQVSESSLEKRKKEETRDRNEDCRHDTVEKCEWSSCTNGTLVRTQINYRNIFHRISLLHRVQCELYFIYYFIVSRFGCSKICPCYYWYYYYIFRFRLFLTRYAIITNEELMSSAIHMCYVKWTTDTVDTRIFAWSGFFDRPPSLFRSFVYGEWRYWQTYVSFSNDDSWPTANTTTKKKGTKIIIWVEFDELLLKLDLYTI